MSWHLDNDTETHKVSPPCPARLAARPHRRSTRHGTRSSWLPSRQDAGSHRLLSLSAPGSACRRPLFLRTIALLTSFLTLPGKFGALSPTLARSKLRPMRRHGSQASSRRGTGPAHPAPPSPRLSNGPQSTEGGAQGPGENTWRRAARAAGSAGRAGGRGRFGNVRSSLPCALCPVPWAGCLMARCSVSAGDYLELGRRWHQLRPDCERNPNSGRFRGERSPNTCCS